jgi:DNA modification methylase
MCYKVHEKNKVNQLSGKDWLKKAKNYWFYNDLNLKEYIDDMISFGFKKRTSGLKLIDQLSSVPHKVDFSINHIETVNINDFEQIINIITNASYDSYHFLIFNDEVIDDNDNSILITDLFISELLKYAGIDYRGKIIIHDNYGEIKIALLFLNRVKDINYKGKIIMKNYIVNKSNDYKSFIFNSQTKLDKFALMHPAPYSYIDVEKLINKFDMKTSKILDPFLGSGSTIIAMNNYKGFVYGIELAKEYVELSKDRIIGMNLRDRLEGKYKILNGNSLTSIPRLKSKFDAIITSPPYHNILKNKGNGVRHDNSQKRQGVETYGDNKLDLGNLDSLDDYIHFLSKVFSFSYNKLIKNGKVLIIISDFTVKKKEIDIHSIIVKMMNKIGYIYTGSGYLIQNQKSIYPFGYPYKIVLNHIFQYVITFEVPDEL